MSKKKRPYKIRDRRRAGSGRRPHKPATSPPPTQKRMDALPLEFIGTPSLDVLAVCRMPGMAGLYAVAHKPSMAILPALVFYNPEVAQACAAELMRAGATSRDPETLSRQLAELGTGPMGFVQHLATMADRGELPMDAVPDERIPPGAFLWRASIRGEQFIVARNHEEASKTVVENRGHVQWSYSLEAWPARLHGDELDPSEPIMAPGMQISPWSMWQPGIEAREAADLREVILRGIAAVPVPSRSAGWWKRRFADLGCTVEGQTVSLGSSIAFDIMGDDDGPPMNPDDVRRELLQIRRELDGASLEVDQ